MFPRRGFPPCLARHASTMSRLSSPSPELRPQLLPPHIAIEEELFRHYNPKAFYPVHPGDIFNSKYKTIVKLGYGSHSTVWLAEDLRKCVSIPHRLFVIGLMFFEDSMTDTSQLNSTIATSPMKAPPNVNWIFLST